MCLLSEENVRVPISKRARFVGPGGYNLRRLQAQTGDAEHIHAYTHVCVLFLWNISFYIFCFWFGVFSLFSIFFFDLIFFQFFSCTFTLSFILSVFVISPELSLSLFQFVHFSCFFVFSFYIFLLFSRSIFFFLYFTFFCFLFSLIFFCMFTTLFFLLSICWFCKPYVSVFLFVFVCLSLFLSLLEFFFWHFCAFSVHLCHLFLSFYTSFISVCSGRFKSNDILQRIRSGFFHDLGCVLFQAWLSARWTRRRSRSSLRLHTPCTRLRSSSLTSAKMMYVSLPTFTTL